jgi:hypothetical protein
VPDVVIVVDLAEERVVLTQPGDFTRLSVTVAGEGASEALAWVVEGTGLGRLQPGGEQVAIDPTALRALAGAAATPEWDEGFAAMCTYAAGKGWLEADGAILAHIEYTGEAG